MLSEDGSLEIGTPRWALPLLKPARYKGARGGRSGGKSHFWAGYAIEEMVADPYCSIVCLREIQRSLRYSVRRLIESKIHKMGVAHMFEFRDNEIRRRGVGVAPGVMLFQGMQDHTAESIKSLEDFKIAWYEEAQRLSARSRDLLLPTIRGPGSELWFSWNPDQVDDPIEELLVANPPRNSIVVHVDFEQNPFRDPVVDAEAAEALRRDPDSYPHIWKGAYNTKSDDQVLSGRWRVDEFDVSPRWDGPYFGGDWGFSTDPSTLLECYVGGNTLYIFAEQYEHGVETDDLPEFYDGNPRAKAHIVRADNARPENISYMKRHGYPRVESVKKWPGSIEDGVSKLRGFDEIVIHVRCAHTAEEARMWKYKRDRLTSDILPVLIDKHNHCWDAVRYALAPLIKQAASAAVW